MSASIDPGSFLSRGLFAGLIGRNFGPDKNSPIDPDCLGLPIQKTHDINVFGNTIGSYKYYDLNDPSTPTKYEGCFDTAAIGQIYTRDTSLGFAPGAFGESDAKTTNTLQSTSYVDSFSTYNKNYSRDQVFNLVTTRNNPQVSNQDVNSTGPG